MNHLYIYIYPILFSDIASLVAQLVKNLPANAGDMDSIPGSGKCPGEVNGNLFQYSCLENPMDRGAWQATVYRVANSPTLLKLLKLEQGSWDKAR